MPTITRKTDYALVAMADLARRSPATVSARDMAERLRMPLPVLRQVLGQLSRQGLVVSTKGARGGYRLGRRPGDITLAEMIESIQGRQALTLCCSEAAYDGDGECQIEDICPIRNPIRNVHAMLRRSLEAVTLEHLAKNDSSTHEGVACTTA